MDKSNIILECHNLIQYLFFAIFAFFCLKRKKLNRRKRRKRRFIYYFGKKGGITMNTKFNFRLGLVGLFVLAIYVSGSNAGSDEWSFRGEGVMGAVGSVDVRYSHFKVPQTENAKKMSFTAWRGERVHGHLALWTATDAKQVRLSVTPLKNKTGDELPSSCIRLSFVKYVLADETLRTCGIRPHTETPVLVEDVIDTASQIDMEAKRTYPVWVSLDVPPDTKPGSYTGQIIVKYEGGGSIPFDISLKVLDLTLPAPSEWPFHLDLWQNPWSVARYHRVEPWSEEHWLLLEPLLKMLDSAGQKCLTTTLIHRPWNGQTYDSFGSMIKWTRLGDGSWEFDYTLFDRWVRFGEKCGITEAINCYSMIPWGYIFYYYDAETGDLESVTAEAGTEIYNGMWTAFLTDFASHLKKQGWFEKTVIAMDERPVKDMLEVVSLVRKTAPGLKLALAGGDHPELYDEVHDYCFLINHKLDPALIKRRTGQGRPTTYYVCCTPFRPNTFTISPLYESAYLGWYAFAKGYSGFLRWAAFSWVLDPLHDTSFDKWESGDTFLVYPGPRSSLRFERLHEGIQDYEKLRIIRTALEKRGSEAKVYIRKLDEALARFDYPPGSDDDVLNSIRHAKDVLLEISRYIAEN